MRPLLSRGSHGDVVLETRTALLEGVDVGEALQANRVVLIRRALHLVERRPVAAVAVAALPFARTANARLQPIGEHSSRRLTPMPAIIFPKAGKSLSSGRT
jgi:hypothetical protein